MMIFREEHGRVRAYDDGVSAELSDRRNLGQDPSTNQIAGEGMPNPPSLVECHDLISFAIRHDRPGEADRLSSIFNRREVTPRVDVESCFMTTHVRLGSHLDPARCLTKVIALGGKQQAQARHANGRPRCCGCHPILTMRRPE